ncbi:tetratricopeptide repeat protein [Suttonella sp. R2A3]|uniref:tetratricopeptide repeat protein n=1 Tax=Suttonella sp. R2A3 TaxID=2908648 RepID=UPI001F293D83|nr:tetratricopeptide repeat protein [Suttonella sp. R2A3]UJF24418.1 tetratricopeptide repeat protein [Suttonella sp. R2A3]
MMKKLMIGLTSTLLITGCATGDMQTQLQANTTLLQDLQNRVITLETQQKAIGEKVARGGINVPTGVTAIPSERRSGVYDDSAIDGYAPPPSSKDGLDQGVELYKAGDVDRAIRVLETFQSNGRGERAVEARYWLADAHYTQRNYQMASRYYGQYLRDMPQSERAPMVLEKLIESLRASGRSADADVLARDGVSAIAGQ